MRLFPVCAALFAAVLTPSIPFQSNAEELPSPDSVAVEINGIKITLGQLEEKRPAAMFQARSNYYEAARKTLEEYVDEFLLEQQAKKENLTVPQLLDRHINNKIGADPSEETLRVYYEGVESAEPYESLRPKILDAIRQRRIAKLKTAYKQSLRSQAKIQVRLAAARAPISRQTAVPRGPSNAVVTLVEYADYECPYCQQVQPTIDKLETEFKGKLAFVYKDYPLPMHANAQKAAEATRCAQGQGKYWEYHDLLASTKRLDQDSLKSHARELKLNVQTFDQCLDKGETAEAVRSDATEAQALGLQGTPSFFVNGRYVTGSLTYERLRSYIVEELGAADTPASRAGVARR
jgi:protein-disulfide isomerase